jgi:hypothetical protein
MEQELCGPALQMHETTLECGDNRLSAVFNVEPHENRADVTLDRRFCNAQYVGDIFIAVASHQEMENFQFPGTQVRMWQTRCQSASYWRRQEASSSMNFLQRIYEGLVWHSFDDIALSSSLQGAVNVFVPVVSRNYDEASTRTFGTYGRDCFHATYASWKPQVHESDIWFVPLEKRQGFLARSRLGDYSHIRACVDDRRYAHSHERMIIHNHHFYLFRMIHIATSAAEAADLRGTSMHSSVPAPISLFSEKLPPMRSTLSLIPIKP